MNSVTIGTILKKLREDAKLSPPDVVAILKSNYSIELSLRTLFSYESGCSTPDVTIFLALCTIYHCQDILYTFGYSNKKITFHRSNSDEEVIINKYRALPAIEKNIILGALGIKKGILLQKSSSLNARGHFLLWISQRHRTLGHYVLKLKRSRYQCSKTFYLPTFCRPPIYLHKTVGS